MIVLISYPAMVFSQCLMVDLLFGAKVSILYTVVLLPYSATCICVAQTT